MVEIPGGRILLGLHTFSAAVGRLFQHCFNSTSIIKITSKNKNDAVATQIMIKVTMKWRKKNICCDYSFMEVLFLHTKS